MDRNQAIGLVLITVIMMGYFIFVGTQQPEKLASQGSSQDSKPKPSATSAPGKDTFSAESDSLLQKKFGGFSAVAKGQISEDSLSNEELQITFNSRGGAIQRVWLKKYATYEQKPLYLLSDETSDMDFVIPSTQGDIHLRDLYFKPVKTDTSLTFRADIGPGQYIEQIYKLRKDSYVLGYELKLAGLDNIVRNDPVKFNWTLGVTHTEKDIKQSREKATVNYYTLEDEFENLGLGNETKEEKIAGAVKWVALKEKFFTSAFIASNNFAGGSVSSKPLEGDSVKVIKELGTALNLPMGDLKTGKGNYMFYFGPNKFSLLRDVPAEAFHKNVDLGWPGISFINRFIVIPVFHLLEGFISNYGIIIIILVVLLKLLLFPLSFKSYISMAKMKVLKPEIDEIKEKYPDDMQKSQMETMDLYRKVGINPLSGCIPVLLQMPFLLAMFNFFPNSIELRQESFLWANDLSTYDAPIMLPFTIPFYGNHVSLFTLFMTLTTIATTFFNNQISTVTGPMKTVSYVMPVVFMFVLNSFPAGLSLYYLVSNLITIGQQFVIRRFVDEEKIKRTLEDNKRKSTTNPGKKSRWMSRLEDAMKAQEEAKKKKKK